MDAASERYQAETPRARRPAGPPGIRGSVGLVIGAVVIALAVNVGYTTWSVNTSQHRWCSALVTLDTADQHAPAPTSKFGRQLVADFHNLRLSFGCG
jgi:hypothetical protein